MEAKELSALRISLASPDHIRSWSYGEVTKPETINYRRLRAEKDGLFDEAIFGPTKDWQCYCGKYKNVRYKGLVCDKCGVEVTRSSVRRERMGHIELAAPIAHVWYTRRVPSHMGLLLDISRRDLDRVLYFAQYVVTHVDEEARQKALKRVDEEMVEREIGLRERTEQMLAAIEAGRDETLAAIQATIDTIEASYEEQLATQTDELMQAARVFQDKLEGKMGSAVRAAMVFAPTDTLVVDKDEEVTAEHLIVVQGVATGRLDEYQGEFEQARAGEVADESVKIESVQAEAEESIAEVQEQFQIEQATLATEGTDRRKEITALRQMEFLGEMRYRELKTKYGQIFKAGMGAEAFLDILTNMNLEKLGKELRIEVRETRSKQRKKKATKRLRVVESLRDSGNRPEWMILTVLPVIPPDLRPMVQLDGGRFATSDLNDLYRRVINRNNRLKRLLELGAPDVIVRNEKRMLQEAVDSLIDNSQRGKALSRRGRRELKSLSDMLKGKKGRFRRNLLGKRVDYSGRSVIVIGPQLKLDQCGLPKTMALELYRPFVISKLVEYNYASNVKGAKRIIEREKPEVWEVLEEVIKDRPVLLNRAPTLHRLGIQAFEPVLVEGKAIQIHPLVTTAFNADFDGDQMAVHIPLSSKAVKEARELMLSTRNLLKPADGTPIIGPSKDMVLGIYYLTIDPVPPVEDENKVRLFADINEVDLAYSLGQLHIHAAVRVQNIYEDGPPLDQPILTTVGRALFNRTMPDELRWINYLLDKQTLNELVAKCYKVVGSDATTEIVDQIKNLGFRYATQSGATIAISDLVMPPERKEIIQRTTDIVAETARDYRRGLLTEEERYQRTIELWTKAKEEVAEAVGNALDPYGSVAIMALSGATKGGLGPITQLAGMRGLMADPSGRIIDLPIRSNFREGLNALEYFISTHGARKGLADTALRTADAGYLTRRLVDVAQDVIVNQDDCGTEGGLWIDASVDIGRQRLSERIFGRVAAGPVEHPDTGEIIIERNQLIDDTIALQIDEAGVQNVYVRSPMVCEMKRGICAMCYGQDLGRGAMVEIGSAVGIVAAQSIGEPGTQLTLRTFHTGGVAEARGDITHGLPRVEELFEARKTPKGESIICDIDGIARLYRNEEGVRYANIIDSRVDRDEYAVPGNWGLEVEDGDDVEAGQRLAFRGEQEAIADHAGRVVFEDKAIVVVYDVVDEHEYEIPSAARLLINDGDRIVSGQQLTEGSKNPHRILQILGREATQLYLLSEVQKVYREQGVNINDKNFEIIIRKMLSRVQITRGGDTKLLVDELITTMDLQVINQKILEEGGQPAAGSPVLLGVTKAALTTDSFLSASSFQHTIRVLAAAAIEGKLDPLIGLKENVIIGKLIPAGTGFHHYFKKDGGLPEDADEMDDDDQPLDEEAVAEVAAD